jgi:3-hydroxyisobutyrate dehydrogenase-like beta-hydroxyacid dehydrogenase
MKLDVWRKDMRVIADFVRQVGSPTPLFRVTAPIYEAARTLWPEQDTGAVCAVLEKMARSKYRRRGLPTRSR